MKMRKAAEDLRALGMAEALKVLNEGVEDTASEVRGSQCMCYGGSSFCSVRIRRAQLLSREGGLCVCLIHGIFQGTSGAGQSHSLRTPSTAALSDSDFCPHRTEMR